MFSIFSTFGRIKISAFPAHIPRWISINISRIRFLFGKFIPWEYFSTFRTFFIIFISKIFEMFSYVKRIRFHKFKIINIIIELITIFVMDKFRSFKFSPKMFFHNNPMFKYRSTINNKSHISSRCNTPLSVCLPFSKKWITMSINTIIMHWTKFIIGSFQRLKAPFDTTFSHSSSISVTPYIIKI